jgi:hypothetical protein
MLWALGEPIMLFGEREVRVCAFDKGLKWVLHMGSNKHTSTSSSGTSTWQQQQQQQQQVWQEMGSVGSWVRRIAALLVGPGGDDAKVRTMLRALGEPITLFGEREVRVCVLWTVCFDVCFAYGSNTHSSRTSRDNSSRSSSRCGNRWALPPLGAPHCAVGFWQPEVVVFAGAAVASTAAPATTAAATIRRMTAVHCQQLLLKMQVLRQLL